MDGSNTKSNCNAGVHTAIILAGGLGTRLREMINNIPKPMAPINGIPFLTYLLEQLYQAKIEHVVLAVGYLWENIYDTFNDKYKSMTLSYSVEQIPLGTGGAIAMAMTKVVDDNVLILNGDTFMDVSFADLWDFHIVNKADITMVLKPLTDFDRYGCVNVEDNSRVVSFEEKKVVKEGLINAGIYVVKRKIFQELPEKFSFETDFLPSAVAKGLVNGYKSDGYFIDIGIPSDYGKAQKEIPAYFAQKKKGL
ncbi:MAG: nucleotidyltransferase family protein [Bacteroidales bacterium]|jgi:D-glycero-alpha-D-manno-heptose 1-phosphate guanylyltransferase|nr:nucleotidyltransferase family protein [Bacteroidales bacterium]